MKSTLNDDNGRDKNGRFALGNRGGPGNPMAQRVNRLRSAMLAAVTADDIREVIAALIEKAKSGDVLAIRELLDRSVGKVKLTVEADLNEREFIQTRVIFGPRLTAEERRRDGIEIIGGPVDAEGNPR